jgi:Mrp family chromosome partitioning ATPase
MKELIQQVADEYDLVVIDTAPVQVVADATVIAQQVDSVLIVADTTRVRRAQLAATIEALERTGAHISGVVLNRVKPRPMDDYYYVHDEAEGPSSPVPRRHAGASRSWPVHPAENLEPK